MHAFAQFLLDNWEGITVLLNTILIFIVKGTKK